MRCLVYLLSTAYDDLATRQEIRHNLWNRPGWDDCVANTGKDVFL